ncbi:pyruvate dehydrogenase (acetyl-transferring), homodimeric type [candidate division KSB1 bacterium]
MSDDTNKGQIPDKDRTETEEWLSSLESVINSEGADRAHFILSRLMEMAYSSGVKLPFLRNTPCVNTIPLEDQPPYPGDRELERRIKSLIRWNAMAMVVHANKNFPGIGGHISTFASNATLLEVGFNHFFKGKGKDFSGDQIYFQGHASPGIYARAYLEGRLTDDQLHNFRKELAEEGGLSSYPHPWLMPDFWEFPTVSMGLSPIMAIYQARFNRYLENRGIKNTSGQRVWAFLGDGETDEPETLGALTLASRERLDNLIFVVNCNLQRLDGPVRGNGSIIQELEAIFRGAGWNVIKVLWGDDWDPLFKKDVNGKLKKRLEELVDGEYQKFIVEDGGYVRDKVFGSDPELLKMVEDYSDIKLKKMRRGGHDPEKVYAAYKAAADNNESPTVILAKTIKGYGLGEAGEGRNVSHQQKKLNEDELREFRARFGIPISDDRLKSTPQFKPAADSPEIKYIRERRQALGGYVPKRSTVPVKLSIPKLAELDEFMAGTGENLASTTMAFVRMLAKLLRNKEIGKYLVPIIPDEARTFGMEALFRQCGIYASRGQLYEPVDSETLLYYKEAKDGQILEEGLTEAGAMSSFIAAGTSYATHGINMLPFFIYYSMFGFQRVGDLIWAANDMRCKGFLLGATAGRTTLNGEGLQHQDGHSHILASTYPNVKSYDPAFAHDIAVLIEHGLKSMYEDGEEVIYYLTLHNENYVHTAMPKGAEEGIINGIYKYNSVKPDKGKPGVVLFGSGSIFIEVLRAQEILKSQFGIGSDIYNVTSYNQLRRDAISIERRNRLHPGKEPELTYVEKVLGRNRDPVIASSDYMRINSDQIAEWIPGGLTSLGTDGFGRSDTRESLRKFFEVDAGAIAYTALHSLYKYNKFELPELKKAMKQLGIRADQKDPWLL